MSEGIRRISHPSQLAALAGWQFNPSHARERVQLETQAASPEKVRSWEAQLTRHQSPCGCEQGGVGLLVGIVGTLLFLLLRPGGWGDPGWPEFFAGLGVVLVTTSAGKAVGILVARYRLQRVTREIQSEWKPQRPTGRDFGPVSITKSSARPLTRCCGNR